MAKADGPKPLTKTEIFNNMAETSGLSKKEVVAVMDSLTEEIRKSLAEGGSQQFTIPGLCKIVLQHKPAVEERQGINPFTGEETTFKAKPATNVVKVRPLKALKDMA